MKSWICKSTCTLLNLALLDGVGNMIFYNSNRLGSF